MPGQHKMERDRGVPASYHPPRQVLEHELILVLTRTVVTVEGHMSLPDRKVVKKVVEVAYHRIAAFPYTLSFIDAVVNLPWEGLAINSKKATFPWHQEINWPWLHRAVGQMHLLCIIERIVHRCLDRIWTAGLQGSHSQGFCCICGFLDAVVVIGPLLSIGLLMLVDQLHLASIVCTELLCNFLVFCLQTQHRSVIGLATSRLPSCSLQQVLKHVNPTLWP